MPGIQILLPGRQQHQNKPGYRSWSGGQIIHKERVGVRNETYEVSSDASFLSMR